VIMFRIKDHLERNPTLHGLLHFGPKLVSINIFHSFFLSLLLHIPLSLLSEWMANRYVGHIDLPFDSDTLPEHSYMLGLWADGWLEMDSKEGPLYLSSFDPVATVYCRSCSCTSRSSGDVDFDINQKQTIQSK
jgi:hypothetical protein